MRSELRRVVPLDLNGGSIGQQMCFAGGGSTGTWLRCGPGGGSTFTTRAVPPLAPGTHDISADFTLSIVDGNTSVGPTIHAWDVSVHRRIELLPEGESILQLVDEPDMRDSVERSLRIESLRVMDGQYASVRIFVHQSPRNLGFDVYLRSGDKEWRIGSFAGSQGRSKTTWVGGYAQSPRSPIDVILRASESAAMEIVDIETIWDGEIIFEDVPIARGGGSR